MAEQITAYPLPRPMLADAPGGAGIAEAHRALSLWLAKYTGPQDAPAAIHATVAKEHLAQALQTPVELAATDAAFNARIKAASAKAAQTQGAT